GRNRDMKLHTCLALAVLGLGALGAAAAPAQGAPRARKETATSRKAGASRTEMLSRAAAALKKLGLYHGETGGKWNPDLHAAMRSFQKSHGLKTTGRLNRDTRRALGIEPDNEASSSTDADRTGP